MISQNILLLLSACLTVLTAVRVDAQFDYLVSTDETSASKAIELNPKGEHKYTLIFLHGMSETGQKYL